jgi:hypothetical protein
VAEAELRPAGVAGALAHLHCGDTYARLAARFGIGVTRVWRYVAELVDLLARHAPDWPPRCRPRPCTVPEPAQAGDPGVAGPGGTP